MSKGHMIYLVRKSTLTPLFSTPPIIILSTYCFSSKDFIVWIKSSVNTSSIELIVLENFGSDYKTYLVKMSPYIWNSVSPP